MPQCFVFIGKPPTLTAVEQRGRVSMPRLTIGPYLSEVFNDLASANTFFANNFLDLGHFSGALDGA
jgi:hypothetical protein